MKTTLLFIAGVLMCGIVKAQVAEKSKIMLSAKEKEMNDSLCNCISKIDLSTIKSSKEAETALTNCMMSRLNLMMELAEEKNIDIQDNEATHKLGVEIGKNLFKQNCASFSKLALLMAEEKIDNAKEKGTVSTGTFKRIDTKGFNYVIISAGESEKSFLWLRQFPNSERLANPASLVGKKVKLTYQEYEAYLPQAKGYYNVKEITGVELMK
ncbi:hypothetical protein [Mucilaginibacter sp.]